MLNHTPQDNASLLSRVLTAGSVADSGTLARLPHLPLPTLCDILELRVDTWPAHAPEAAVFAPTSPVPLLITPRCPNEGGQNNLSPAERDRLARLFLPAAALLDIEIASLTTLAPLIQASRDTGTLLVASYHDFKTTPPLDTLRSLRDTALRAGAQIIKFATTLHTTADLATLAALLEEPGHPPLSLMGMGKLGRVSRLLLAQLGSVINYGYLDQPTVPGQWPAARLRTLINELGQPCPPASITNSAPQTTTDIAVTQI